MSDEQDTTTPAGPATAGPEYIGHSDQPPQATLAEEQAVAIRAEEERRVTDDKGNPRFDLAGNFISPETEARLAEVDKILTSEKPSEEELKKNFALQARAQGLSDDVIDGMLRARQTDPDAPIGTALDRLRAEEALQSEQDWLRARGLLPAEEPAPETPAEEIPTEETFPQAWTPEQQAQPVLPTADLEAFASEIGVPVEPLARMRDTFLAPFRQELELARLETQAAVAAAVTMRVTELQRNDPDYKVYAKTLLDMLKHVDPQHQPLVALDPNFFSQFVGAAKGQYLDKLQKPAPEGRVVGKFVGEEARPSTAERGVSVHPDVARQFGLTDADLEALQKTRGSTR